MPQPASVTSPPHSETVLSPRPALHEQGLQLRLFPSTATEGSQNHLTTAVDLRVADDLCGMYYIG